MRKVTGVNREQSAGMNLNRLTLLQFVVCGLLVFAAAQLQAQLLYKTTFSTVEGYTNGWAIGQPANGNKWFNANNDWDWVNANQPGAYTKLNNGCSWWPTVDQLPDWPGGPWHVVTITNCTATGGAMKIASDGNFGTNAQTYFWKMDFPKQVTGPITVTWDWSFHCTNEIPADYDPTNNNYTSTLPGYDTGFTFSDWENRFAGNAASFGPPYNPNWIYGDLFTPFRLGSLQDARHNAIGDCAGNGDWNNYGPQFKDGKVLHMKLIAYVTNAPAEYMNSYDGFALRDGETRDGTPTGEPTIWQTAYRAPSDDPYLPVPSGMRRCAGGWDPTSGVNCLMLWMNGNQYPNYVLVSNIVVLGPIPVLSIERAGASVNVTYSGTLQSADFVQGPYNDVVGQSTNVMTSLKTWPIPANTTKKFYRAYNVFN